MSKEFETSMEWSDEVFDSLDAKGKDLSGRHFENCTFTKCSLAGSSARGASFLDCAFTACDLSNVQLTGARFRDARFTDSKLVGVNWTTASAVSHLAFHKCLLNYSIFEGLDLRKSFLEECTAHDADFTRCNLSEAVLRGTDLARARFSNTDLRKADFRRATSYSIRPDENKLKGAKFSLPEATLLLYGLEIELEE